MSDTRQIDPKIFEYLNRPESERVAKPSEHFPPDAKEEEKKMTENNSEYVIRYRWLAGDASRVSEVGIEARNDEEAKEKFEVWKKENAGRYQFWWGPFLYKKLV